jgi:hypothetical protein
MASANKRRSTEVDDPVAAFRKLESFGRKILAVPKPENQSKIKKKKSASR